MKRRCILIVTIALMSVGALFLGKGIYIFAKAQFAQVLLKSAWEKTINGRRDFKPWPWADTHPVMKMIIPGIDTEYIVLEGCNGNSLAFAPGHLNGTPLPGERGNIVLSGHRDTHFKFLKNLRPNDIIILVDKLKYKYHYRVESTSVTDKNDLDVLHQNSDSELTLITCYPFNSPVPGGRLRYIVKLKLQK